ncbi:potassium-transporting ATPase subunit KdpC [Leptospira fluminis]|uniref:Potassium-transporting ATPase KdpC subunit n=1 Tax=Leptospira fluminis TaxID=2484979 RepID=A0A4R9GL67_9LEPT|nr:potassium-transporting ATPase subunit KdpC [Leptospira fluminis]TGK15372.1 potassium-transporting ATPase subunit KdpC [Leptospira fluminis]
MRRAVSQFFFWTILCGVLYPFLIYGIGKIAFREQSQGSLIVRNGKVTGSVLLAQKSDSPEFFHPRPSAAGFNPESGAASNLGTTSETLRKQVEERRKYWSERGGVGEVPSELVFASASGLDPHLSLKAVEYQLPLVAKARGLNEEQIRHLKDLVAQVSEPPQWGIFGEEKVNVLKLNLALQDSAQLAQRSDGKNH